MSLDKIMRLSGHAPAASPDEDQRELVNAVRLALSEATTTTDPAHAAEMVYAALTAAEGLSEADGSDWVEATAGQADGSIMLAGDGSKPYGDVPYADPGYLPDGKPRYPVDEKHVRAAWSYISMSKNAARYTAQQLAKIKAKIKSAMGQHGIGANVAAATADSPPAMAQMLDWVELAGKKDVMPDVPMSHAPMKGKHTHAHTVSMTHGHEHVHNDDNSHRGSAHGSNAEQDSWAAKGGDGWGSRGDW